MKEPDGANLDRIQIIKGWVDAKGEPQDQVFDVVWSGGRKPDAKGKVPAVGNTVDVSKAMYTNAIGSGRVAGIVDGSQIRSEAGRGVLRPRAGHPDATLEHVRRSARQPSTVAGRCGHGAGTRLDITHLVHAIVNIKS